MQGVTEKYHSHHLTPERADELETEAIEESGFTKKEDLFEGKVYDEDRIGTRISRGFYEEKPAVLKVQLLEPGIEEVDIMERFSDQNRSKKIRTPKIYDHTPYAPEKGFGFTVMENIQGKPIFEGLASEEDMKNFADFYRELHDKAISSSFLPPKIYEKDARVATGLRLANWSAIALKKGTLDKEGIVNSSRHLIRMTLDGVGGMEFTHGHLSGNDVLVTPDGENILFSAAFWSYRPEYYDTTFQIWASLKNLKGEEILSPEKAVEHCEQWKETFLELPGIGRNPMFSKYFASNMRERAIGALLLDINQDHKGKDNEKQKEMFRSILEHYSKNHLPSS